MKYITKLHFTASEVEMSNASLPVYLLLALKHTSFLQHQPLISFNTYVQKQLCASVSDLVDSVFGAHLSVMPHSLYSM